MSDLLLIGDATDEMKGRFAEKFAIHILYDNEDPAAWIARHGSKISYVATNGHDGVKSAFVDSMPNLKAISCYGVGYKNKTKEPKKTGTKKIKRNKMTKAKKKTPLGRGLSELLTEGDGQQAHIKELEERTIELKKKLEDLKFENKKLLSILENLTQALIDK